MTADRFQEAVAFAEARLAVARANGDVPGWTRALAAAASATAGIFGREGAIRFLRQQPWPEDTIARVVLELALVQALLEARGRGEAGGLLPVEGPGDDVEGWTAGRFQAEAWRALDRLWGHRSELDGLKSGSLREYFGDVDNPGSLRGTLRDQLQFHMAALLADPRNWSLRQTADVARLDLESLLATPPRGMPDPPLAGDDSVHPLVRMTAVLADLEAFHESRGERDAVLDIRIERFRWLYARFPDRDSRKRVAKVLEESLPAFRDIPWWSYGMAEGAAMLLATGEPGRRVRARDLLLEGRDAWPGTEGARRCEVLRAQIEASELRVTSDSVTGEGLPSLRVRYRNVPRIRFLAWREDPSALTGGSARVPADDRAPDAEWHVDLPPTPDLETHVQPVVLPLARGTWRIALSDGPDDDSAKIRERATTITITDLMVLRRMQGPLAEIEVRSARTGRPVAGAQVDLLRRENATPGWAFASSTRTDAEGMARLSKPADGSPTGTQYSVKVHLDGDQVFNEELFSFRQEADETCAVWGDESSPVPARTSPWHRGKPIAVVSTDRPVYRPGQTVLWKVVLFGGDEREGDFRVLPGRKLVVRLSSSGQVRGEQVEGVTNRLGSFSGEFRLAPATRPGKWSIWVQEAGGGAQFQVEEYRRPGFQVVLDSPEDTPRPGVPTVSRGRVTTWSGEPVRTGRVQWQVERQAPDGRRRTGGLRRALAVGNRREVLPLLLARGEGTLDPDGTFEIPWTPGLPEKGFVSDGARVLVNVTDAGGGTVAATRRYRVSEVGLEARLDAGPGFFKAGATPRVAAILADLEGNPVPGTGTWRLVRVRTPEKAVLPEGPDPDDPAVQHAPEHPLGFDPEEVVAAWPDGDALASGSVEHDASGHAEWSLPPLTPGVLRILYQTVDRRGGVVRASETILVPGDPIPVMGLLRVSSPSVQPGGMLRILAATGLPDQPMTLTLDRNGRTFERRELEPGTQVLGIPVALEHRGGFVVTLTVARDHAVVQLTQRIDVPWADRQLQVQVDGSVPEMQAGETREFTVRVTSPFRGGAPVAGAEVLARMTDRSLEGLFPVRSRSPLDEYPDRRCHAMVQEDTSEIRLWAPGKSPTPLGFHHPRSGGFQFRFREPSGWRRGQYPEWRAANAPVPDSRSPGEIREDSRKSYAMKSALSVDSSPPSLKEPESDPGPSLRSDFAETAFWMPHVVTGANGTAALRFRVPESLTEWTARFDAHTPEVAAGTTQVGTRSTRLLSLRLELPRVATERDRFDLVILLRNRTRKPLSGTLNLAARAETGRADQSDRLGLPRERTISIAPLGEEVVRIPVTVAVPAGTLRIEARVRAGALRDGEARTLAVRPHRWRLAYSRFLRLADAGREDVRFPGEGADGSSARSEGRLVVTLAQQGLGRLPGWIRATERSGWGSLGDAARALVAVAILDKVRGMSTHRDEALPGSRAVGTDDSPPLIVPLENWEPAPERRRPEVDLSLLHMGASYRAWERSASLRRVAREPWPWPWPGAYQELTPEVLSDLLKAVSFGLRAPSWFTQEVVARIRSAAWDQLDRLPDECPGQFGREVDPVESARIVRAVAELPAGVPAGVFPEVDRRLLLDEALKGGEEAICPRAWLAIALDKDGRADASASIQERLRSLLVRAPSGAWHLDPTRPSGLSVGSMSCLLDAALELAWDREQVDGIALWLFLQLEFAPSSFDGVAADVMVVLARYLDRTGRLRGGAEVALGSGESRRVLDLPPHRADPRVRSVFHGLDDVSVESREPGLVLASATWDFTTAEPPSQDHGDVLTVHRELLRREPAGDGWVLRPVEPGTPVAQGDELVVRLTLRALLNVDHVLLHDPRPGGFEPVPETSRTPWVVRDDGSSVSFSRLDAGEHELRYSVRAAIPGRWTVGPAIIQALDAPELVATSAALTVVVQGLKGGVQAPSSATK